MNDKPRELEVVGFRLKKIATRLGEITIKRRLYRNKNTGDYLLLLKLKICKGKDTSSKLATN